MSVQVANVNLSSATVGQTGTLVSFQNLMPPPTISQQMRPQDSQSLSHLSIFNESGCLITITLVDTRQTKTLPAGRWLSLAIPAHESAVTYQVLAVASGSPFGNLLADFYGPGEAVDDLGVLGNSPIGVNGPVSTTTTTGLKNDGNGPGTQIVETTPSDQGSSAFNLNNDGSGLWQVLSAGVQRIVASVTRGNAGAGKAVVVLGDAGDTSILTVHGTADKATNATNAMNVGDGANGAFVTVGDDGSAVNIKPTVGNTRDIILQSRDGSGGHSVFRATASGGTTFLMTTGVQFTGTITSYNGQAAVGFGVPVMVAQVLDAHITSTSLSTVLSYTPSVTGHYRVSVYAHLSNSTSKVDLEVDYTDDHSGVGENINLGGQVTISPFFGTLSASANNPPAQNLAVAPIVIKARASTVISVAFQDAVGTPNDFVSVFVERLA